MKDFGVGLDGRDSVAGRDACKDDILDGSFAEVAGKGERGQKSEGC